MTEEDKDKIISNLKSMAIVTKDLDDEEFERFLNQAKNDFEEYTTEEKEFIIKIMIEERKKIKL